MIPVVATTSPTIPISVHKNTTLKTKRIKTRYKNTLAAEKALYLLKTTIHTKINTK